MAVAPSRSRRLPAWPLMAAAAISSTGLAGPSFAAPPGKPAPAQRLQTIPAEFHGVWQRDCRDPAAAETWLRIGPDHVTFYESSAAVVAAARRVQTLALIVEISGEGETWLDVLRFQLEPGSDPPVLVDASSGTGLRRQRCAAAQRQP